MAQLGPATVSFSCKPDTMHIYTFAYPVSDTTLVWSVLGQETDSVWQ